MARTVAVEPSVCYLSAVRTAVPRVILFLSIAGCHGDRDALHGYLATDHPALTAGTPEALTAFEAILASTEPAEQRINRLDDEVLVPYRGVVDRLEAYAPSRPVVERHHTAWLAATRRQLSALEAARAAIEAGRPLAEVRWIESVTADAKALGVPLAP